MLNNIVSNIKKKSLKERFLLVLGILFFLVYLILGLFIIFMKNFPLAIQSNYRIAFGVLLIVYASIRFFRIINDNKN
jgi:cytochrome c biogenesis protein CcdA